jgi:hypothetical protein
MWANGRDLSSPNSEIGNAIDPLGGINDATAPNHNIVFGRP